MKRLLLTKKVKCNIVEINYPYINMNFNTNEINTSLQQKFGSEATRIASLFAVNREALFILPAFQQQIFNFLFYEKQWRFDRLHEMMLLFQPGIELADYCVQYELSSRKFENKLRVMLPYQFEHPSLHSLNYLFSNAAALEKKMTDIHQLQFKQKTSRISLLKEQVKAALVMLPF